MPRPKLAVMKFASCDGCQLSILDCEDELLDVAELVHIANFMEATREVAPPPYDVTLVEGSVTTPHDAERIRQVRAETKVLVTIGACATAGGIQALRNFADVREFTSLVYATPSYISTLETSTPIAAHVKVDYELRGCPVDKGQLIGVLRDLVQGKPPRLASHSVCIECKRRGVVCVMVAKGEPCLGPVTHDGCGALCPSYSRGCFGCFGPADTTNTASMAKTWSANGADGPRVLRAFRSFNAGAPAFADEAEKQEQEV